jgi:hypothetical protein
MAKKPTAKAISQFQALAQKNTPMPMKPPTLMPAGMPPKVMPKKKPIPKKKPMAKNGLGMVKGAMPGRGMMGGM